MKDYRYSSLFRNVLISVMFAIVLSIASAGAVAPTEEIALITAGETFETAPEWAVLERRLIDLMNISVDVFVGKYLNDDGSFKYPRSYGKFDDGFEPFHNWPTFYALGGDEKFRTLAQREIEAVIRYNTDRGVLEKDFPKCGDWFHIGEGYHIFYTMGLADPTNAINRERARRFSGFYLNEDPDARNYDPDRKIVLSTMNGSQGPRKWSADAPDDYVWTSDHYGLPYYDLPGIAHYEDMADPEKMKAMAHAAHARWGRGDGPINLAISSMMVHAFLLTGESQYRTWVTDYVRAWMRRVHDNNGILPDNVGLSGSIAEYNDGRWYGGLYGWTVYHGWGSLMQSTGMAAENALLLTGNNDFLDFPRGQIDMLIKLGIMTNDTLYVPHKHGEPGKVINKPLSFLPVLRNPDGTAKEVNGWFKFMPMDPVSTAHLWNMSMAPADLERAKLIRNHDPQARWSRDWERIEAISRFMAKDHGGHEAAWRKLSGMTYIPGLKRYIMVVWHQAVRIYTHPKPFAHGFLSRHAASLCSSSSHAATMCNLETRPQWRRAVFLGPRTQ